MGDFTTICELRGKALNGQGCTNKNRYPNGVRHCAKLNARGACTTRDVDTLSLTSSIKQLSPPPRHKWDYTLHPVNIYELPSGQIYVDLDPRSKVNAAAFTGPRFFVSPTGNNGAAGTSAAPVASMAVALDKIHQSAAQGGSIQLAAGYYDIRALMNDPTNTAGLPNLAPTKHVALIGPSSGQAIIGVFRRDLVWTADAGAYITPRSNVHRVLDLAVLDAKGDATDITNRPDAATVNGGNGWFQDGANLRIRRPDGAVPTDDNTLVILNTTNSTLGGADVDFYAENIISYGGANGAFQAVNGGKKNIILVNVTAKYQGAPNSPSNALTTAGLHPDSFVGYFRCVGARAARDGISMTGDYHLLTVDCRGYSNGLTGSTSNNGLTHHLNGKGIDVNGEFFDNSGGNIRSINGTSIWLVNSFAHDDRGDVIYGGTLNPCDFNIGDIAEMFMYKCRAAGSGISFSGDARTYAEAVQTALPNQIISNGTLIRS